jgi:hypothetical protein
LPLYLHYSYESTKCLHAANRKSKNNKRLMCANYYAVFTEKLRKLRNKALILVPLSMGTYFNWKKKAVYSPLSSLIGDNGCADNPKLPHILHHKLFLSVMSWRQETQDLSSPLRLTAAPQRDGHYTTDLYLQILSKPTQFTHTCLYHTWFTHIQYIQAKKFKINKTGNVCTT